jgi:hypothetical protein
MNHGNGLEQLPLCVFSSSRFTTMEVVEYSHAALLCREIWSKTAYPSFLMLRKLLQLTETSLEAYVRDPAAIKANKVAVCAAIKAARYDEPEDLW